MPFDEIEIVDPPSPKAQNVPLDGVAVQARALGRRGGGAEKTRYIRVVIGARLAQAASLRLEAHKLRLAFGSGSDAGMIQVSVDQQNGRFQAKRDKAGRYALTINAATADGLFSLEFPSFTRDQLEAVKPAAGPSCFVFRASPEMLAVED